MSVYYYVCRLCYRCTISKKNYGTLPVLQGIDLQVQKGEVVCIVGPSGAGKTTLLQIIGCLDIPDSGSITFNEKHILELPAKAKAQFRNQHLGFVFQFHNLLPEFSALENVALPALINGTSMLHASARALQLLDYFGLANRQQHKPSQLSGGEQQRVAFARALMNNPEVILADEPTGNLDTQNAKEMHNLIFKLRTDFNSTFIIVTHNNELANMTDRKITMRDGRVIE